jgi:cell division protein FtsB
MNLLALFMSLMAVIFLVIGFYLYITVELLKEKIKVLQDNNTFLDEEITRLTTKVHKNEHNIQKQLIKG